MEEGVGFRGHRFLRRREKVLRGNWFLRRREEVLRGHRFMRRREEVSGCTGFLEGGRRFQGAQVS